MPRPLPRSCAIVLVLLSVLVPAAAAAAEPPVSFGRDAKSLANVERHALPALDNTVLLADALKDDGKGRPWRFAQSRELGLGTANAGTWEKLADGSRLWRLRVASPGARHLNLGFSHLDLPAGARLWVYNPAGDDVEGPYTAANRSSKGRFFTPIVFGDEIVVELHVPAEHVPAEQGGENVELLSVQHGFRDFGQRGPAKSGSCNNDVVCPEGDSWRDQIRSVALYSVGGSSLCTGQLVNNTAEDNTPYFLSAHHCDVFPTNDDTVVVYWKFESPVCGQQGGGSLDISQSGSIFRASDFETDFLLVELSEPPPPEAEVFFTGWDVSGDVPQGSVAIHHPSADEKAISFNDDPLGTTTWVTDALTHWEVDNWEDGTTERGSSGGCLWDPDSKLCVGTLSGGFASCTEIDIDLYGKLSLAWDSLDSPDGQLRHWLDPVNAGVEQLEGRNPDDAGGDFCEPSDTVLCLQGRRFQIEVERVGNDGPGPARTTGINNDDSGLLYFFGPDNWEMLIKVLDGCDINGHWWVFSASATSVEFTLTVTDVVTGKKKEYFHANGEPNEAITDTAAFDTCP